MAQRDLVKFGGGLLLGLAAGLLVAGLIDWPWGGTDTEVTLSAVNGSCTLGKATHVRVKQDKQLEWDIANFCTDGSKTVMVGNFRRTAGPSGAADCKAAGPDYPFTDAAEAARTSTVDPAARKNDGRVRPARGDIRLKVLKLLGPGENDRLYYFDICLDGAKADPEVMVER
jgi:hypothetical protein